LIGLGVGVGKKDIDANDKHNIILGVNVYYESKILGVVS
jgi:hypothetical protein